VLAVEMLDGSPHAATVHYAHAEEPLVFYFETCREYRKAEVLLGRVASRASVVIGTHEKTTKTMQMDGVVQLLSVSERDICNSVYLKKFPEKTEKLPDPKCILFKFTPTWWRFSDFDTPEGKKIILSTD
jgi:uncharacterized protein YhbP (UPF0306 family)